MCFNTHQRVSRESFNELEQVVITAKKSGDEFILDCDGEEISFATASRMLEVADELLTSRGQ